MRTSFATFLLSWLLTAAAGAQATRPALGPPHNLQGDWRLCIRVPDKGNHNAGTQHCGALAVASDSYPQYQQFAVHYALKVRYGRALAAAIGASAHLGGVTFATTDSVTPDSAAFVLQLGSQGGYDDGSLIAHLTWTGPRRLEGEWWITCYNSCPARGTLTVERIR